jgi:hypothetical protein
MLPYVMDPPTLTMAQEANVWKEMAAGMLQMLESMDNQFLTPLTLIFRATS